MGLEGLLDFTVLSLFSVDCEALDVVVGDAAGFRLRRATGPLSSESDDESTCRRDRLATVLLSSVLAVHESDRKHWKHLHSTMGYKYKTNKVNESQKEAQIKPTKVTKKPEKVQQKSEKVKRKS